MSLLKKYRAMGLKSGIQPTNLTDIRALSGNIYESINIAGKRANQIRGRLKEELNGKLEEFAHTTETLEEVMENREQIEISRYYEKLPHTTILAMQEFFDGEIYHRRADDEA